MRGQVNMQDNEEMPQASAACCCSLLLVMLVSNGDGVYASSLYSGKPIHLLVLTDCTRSKVTVTLLGSLMSTV